MKGIAGYSLLHSDFISLEIELLIWKHFSASPCILWGNFPGKELPRPDQPLSLPDWGFSIHKIT
jgi:hypothetical protein